MADSVVTWDLIARDRASSTFKRLSGESDHLLGRVKTLAGAAGLAGAGYAAVNFAKTSVRAFADAQRSQTQLQDAYARFPAIASVQIETLRSLNKALQAKTGFDDDALASGEAVLAQFKLTGEQIKATIPLVADYAARTGQDIPTAATNLGRSFLGNTRALKTLGIAYKSTGDQARDTANIIDLLRAKVGGFAEREGKTAEGRARILATEFQNVEEQLGAALLPALTKLGNFLLHDVIPPLQHTADFVKRNKAVIEPLTKAVLLGAAAWKAYSLYARAATSLSVKRVAGAGASSAVGGTLGRGSSPANPLFVAVVTGGVPGGPTVIAPGGAAASESRLARFGRGSLQVATVLPLVAEFGKFWAKSFEKHGFGIPGVFHVGGEKKIDPEGLLSPAFKKEVDRLGGVDKALAYYRKSAAATARTMGTLAKSSDTTSTSLHQQARELDRLQAKALNLSSGEDDLRSAIHNMAVVAGGQSSRALQGNSDAALANRDALRAAVASAEGYLQTLKQHGASAPHVAQVERELAKAIKHSADETYGNRDAVHALLKELHFLPGQIAPVVGAFYDLANAAARAGNEIGAAKSIAATEQAKAAHKKAGDDAGKSFTGGYSQVVDSGVADAATKAANAAQAAFDKAKSKMQADTQTILGFFRQTKQELISTFSAFETSGTDILGASGANANFHAQLKQGATAMHTFAHLWHRLNDLGLDPRLLAQFTGPDYIPAMREILRSGRKGIRRDNRLERQITRDARGIAQTATDDKYGRLLHHDLDTLPRKLSREMVRDLHHAKFVVEFDTAKHDRHNGRKVRQHK